MAAALLDLLELQAHKTANYRQATTNYQHTAVVNTTGPVCWSQWYLKSQEEITLAVVADRWYGALSLFMLSICL